MKRINLYIHYDSVTNHVMTRAISFKQEDFLAGFTPNNMILAEAPADFGSYDARTNFKILRGQDQVHNYFKVVESEGLRLSNWIDFESLEAMHQLTPNEIAELLYLFHANTGLRSAFFYKLQNNYVYLTLPNGLNKVYYRHVNHFYPRIQRVITEKMTKLVNEDRRFFFMRKEKVPDIPLDVVEGFADLFAGGLKVNFTQAYQKASSWFVPLDIIEDEITLLTLNQKPQDHVGTLNYDTNSQQWSVDLIDLSEKDF